MRNAMLEADSSYRVQNTYGAAQWNTRSPPNGYSDAYQNSRYETTHDTYRPSSVNVTSSTSAPPFRLPPTIPNTLSQAEAAFHNTPRTDQQYPYPPPQNYGWQSNSGYGTIGSAFPPPYANNGAIRSNANINAGVHASPKTPANGGYGGFRTEEEPRTRDALANAVGMAIDESAELDRQLRRRQQSFSPTGSDNGVTVSPSLSDMTVDNNYERLSAPQPGQQVPILEGAFGMNGGTGNLMGGGAHDGVRNRPVRRGANRDEFDGPHQLLPRPSPEYTAQQERKLPHLPTHLHVEEQDSLLSLVNDRLSQCAFDFVARYQFPIPLTQDMRPVSRPQDREWTEWVMLLKRLATKRRIPARVLYNNQIKQFVTILENSLEMRHAARHQSRPLKDDRNILQLISAGIQVAKILKDAPAMDYLDRLYVDTDKRIQERSAAGRSAPPDMMGW